MLAMWKPFKTENKRVRPNLERLVARPTLFIFCLEQFTQKQKNNITWELACMLSRWVDVNTSAGKIPFTSRVSPDLAANFMYSFPLQPTCMC